MSLEPESTITISAEALRRLEVEVAFARGEAIQHDCGRTGHWVDWRRPLIPSWNWEWDNYRVKPKAASGTKAELLDQILVLLNELRQADA